MWEIVVGDRVDCCSSKIPVRPQKRRPETGEPMVDASRLACGQSRNRFREQSKPKAAVANHNVLSFRCNFDNDQIKILTSFHFGDTHAKLFKLLFLRHRDTSTNIASAQELYAVKLSKYRVLVPIYSALLGSLKSCPKINQPSYKNNFHKLQQKPLNKIPNIGVCSYMTDLSRAVGKSLENLGDTSEID